MFCFSPNGVSGAPERCQVHPVSFCSKPGKKNEQPGFASELLGGFRKPSLGPY